MSYRVESEPEDDRYQSAFESMGDTEWPCVVDEDGTVVAVVLKSKDYAVAAAQAFERLEADE